MAFEPNATWDVVFSFKDNNGNFSTTEIHFDQALTYAEVSLAASSLAANMQAVSDARVTGFTITGGFRNDALLDPAATSEVERKLILSLDTASKTGAVILKIPSPVFALEQPRTDVVAADNAILAALVAQLTNGGLGGGNAAITWFGEDVVRCSRAVIGHVRRKPRS